MAKRNHLFFGMEAIAPWPESFPKGRIIQEKDRHVTLAFLGSVEKDELLDQLRDFPSPPFQTGFSCLAEEILFLPQKKPRVVAWHIRVDERIKSYQKQLTDWLIERGYPPKNPNRPFLPHITLSRGKFSPKAWERSFSMLPVVLNTIQLYESLGHSQFQVIWKYPLALPFEEFEHTADIAFVIRGSSFSELYHNASTALAFQSPSLLEYAIEEEGDFQNLDQIIQALNRVIARSDEEIGVPFKAVSYHGDVGKAPPYHWEMIVDV